MADDGRGLHATVHFDQADRLRVALERRGEGAPHEPDAARGQKDAEERHREERLHVFAAAAARAGAAARYDVLRSRYDCRITAAACMSISRCASLRLRPAARSCSDASAVVSDSSQSTTVLD